MFTLLVYHHANLTMEEVLCTLQMLSRLDISKQAHRYDRWFASVEQGLNGNDRKAMCNVRHISLTDSRQFETLCRIYCYCMEAINLYLNTFLRGRYTYERPRNDMVISVV